MKSAGFRTFILAVKLIFPFFVYQLFEYFFTWYTNGMLRFGGVQIIGEFEQWISFAIGRINIAYWIGLIGFYIWFLITLVVSWYGFKDKMQYRLSLGGLIVLFIILAGYIFSQFHEYFAQMGLSSFPLYLLSLGFMLPFTICMFFSFPNDMVPFGIKWLAFFSFSYK